MSSMLLQEPQALLAKHKISSTGPPGNSTIVAGINRTVFLDKGCVIVDDVYG